MRYIQESSNFSSAFSPRPRNPSFNNKKLYIKLSVEYVYGILRVNFLLLRKT